MENITVKDIVEMTGGVLMCGDENTPLTDICINSKIIKEGDLFVPIIGEKVDAHRFIESALEKGAATLTSQHNGVIVAEKPYIRVDNTRVALQRIGAAIRKRMPVPVIAVTGSVGKTTTREMITHALSSEKRTFHTEKNLNSQIGVPITLSRMSSGDEIAVLELGISEDGQMDILSRMVKPNMAVVTTIGVAHIEFMRTRENIRRQKLSIVHFMKKDGTLFLNGDDELLRDAVESEQLTCRTLFYGTEDWCDYYARDIVYHSSENEEQPQPYTTFTCVHDTEQVFVRLNTLGRHNVENCVVALAVANENGIPMSVAAERFADFQGQRQKVIRLKNKFTMIDDTYNASPDSVKASINVLCDIPCEGRRVAVLGDMFELGEDEVAYHREIGEFLLDKPVDEVIVLGELSQNIKQVIDDSDSKIKTYTFSDNEEAAIYLMATLRLEDVVLLKASNGMNLKEIVNILLS
ncbi:MAG: UDP-N-acetylmuramoyl-tripeptide--D-alanyl-D-alanine ligase [Bacteroidales bacterium]|nr:UDP-N-acetylmuramoyl-tripeptide--D-alanyl-D-alanine ligase [Clostridium sp.]MCM1203214.1 UDP-N-acetylmuramoyl-tripeptide--D-alanyl-D-alanine ligase [Bacteroidales bacterium]